MIIKIKKMYPDAKIPVRATSGAVGYDVYAYHVVDKNDRSQHTDLPVEILPGKSVLIGTGIIMAVPFPVDCQVRPRSGLANKHDIELSNSPGTIDPDYRGEAGILLRNRGDKPYTVNKGDRIAQLVFVKAEIPRLVEMEILPPTSRGKGGFGSTGVSAVILGDAEYLQEQKMWDEHFMRLAVAAAGLSNCLRDAEKENGAYIKDQLNRYCGAARRFGCVIVIGHNIVATGHNVRTAECSEELGCIREREGIASGTQTDKGCLHAEKVALQNYARMGGPSLEGAVVYVNAEPCMGCAKDLIGTGIAAVVVPEGVYPTNGLSLMMEAGVEVRHVAV